MTPPSAPELTRQDLDILLASSPVGAGRLRSSERLAEGTFNAAYRLRLDDGTGLVVKAAPRPDASALTYERDLLRAEELYYREAATVGTVPVPKVVYADFSRQWQGRDVLVMSECAGASWYSQRDRLRSEDRNRLRRMLGVALAELHRVTGPGFGYPRESVAPLSASWSEAFQAMVAAVLSDAVSFRSPLPRPTEEISALIAAAGPTLEQIRDPVLVHFDLWDGNILVDTDRSIPTITGLIDGERMFWGDPAADFVSLALFGDIHSDDAFIGGYRHAGGTVTLDEATLRLRLSIYRSYLYMIMLVEAAPRGSSGSSHERTARLVWDQLTQAFDTIERELA